MNYFDILLAKKLEDDRDPKVEGLSITENGRYHEDGVVYDPVIVNVPETPLSKLTVTENGTYTAPTDTGYNEVDVNVPLPDNAYMLKEIEDVEIATFTDGSDLPMPKLEVAIEPQQDLHGYDHPWVGGAGKNKCPINESTIAGATYIVDTDINIASGTWTFSFESAVTTNCSLQITDVDGNTLASVGINNPSRSTTVTINAVGKHLKFYGYAGTYKNIQLEEGSTATTFEPYSNICPIIGWDEVNVGVSGVNIWDEEWELGSIDTETGANVTSSAIIRSKNHILVNPNTVYYHLGRLQLYFYDKDKNYISYLAFANEGVFTTPSNAVYMRFTITSSYGTTYNNDISINYPSTDTEYHAYNGTTYTIDLNGTRYGVKVDLVSGVLTVDRAIKTFDGSENWIEFINPSVNQLYTTINGVKNEASQINVISDTYKGIALNDRIGNFNTCYSATNAICFNIENTSADEWKAMLQSQNVTVVYKLVTPLTIQLSPTQVKSLVGQNNVWADTGNILDLSYLAKEE